MRRPSARLVFGCASVLLGYPGDDFAADLDDVAAAVRRLPAGATRDRLERVRAWLAASPPAECRARFVETFDFDRRRTLHLTYYRYGDTRDRGMALAALGAVYGRSGFRVIDGELPDFLPGLLELAAVAPEGGAVLVSHRADLEVLEAALSEAGSPYAEVLAAVTDVLGRPSRADRDAAARYRAEGPPIERVGLEGSRP